MARESLKKLASWKEMAAGAFICLFIVVYFFKSVNTRKTEVNRALRTKVAEMKNEKKSLEEFLAAINKQEGGDALESLKRSPDLRVQLLTGEKKPAFSHIAPFFTTISTGPFRSGTTIDAMSHQLPKTEGGVESTNYTVKIHGSYSSVSAFLEKVIGLEALVSIENMAITLFKDKGTKEGKVASVDPFAVELDMSGLLYKPVPGGGGTPSPTETTASTSTTTQ